MALPWWKSNELEMLLGFNIAVLSFILVFFVRYRRRLFRTRRVMDVLHGTPGQPAVRMTRLSAQNSSILFSSDAPAVPPQPPEGSRVVQVTLYKPQVSTMLGISLAAPVSTVTANEDPVQPSVASLLPGTVAEQSLRIGDFITAVNGCAVVDMVSAATMLRQAEGLIVVDLLRPCTPRPDSATTAAADEPAPAAAVHPPPPPPAAVPPPPGAGISRPATAANVAVEMAPVGEVMGEVTPVGDHVGDGDGDGGGVDGGGGAIQMEDLDGPGSARSQTETFSAASVAAAIAAVGAPAPAAGGPAAAPAWAAAAEAEERSSAAQDQATAARGAARDSVQRLLSCSGKAGGADKGESSCSSAAAAAAGMMSFPLQLTTPRGTELARPWTPRTQQAVEADVDSAEKAGNFVKLMEATRKVQAEAAALRALNAAANKAVAVAKAEGSSSSAEKGKEPVTEVPSQFRCPISQEIMEDPVTTADGHTYERREIFRWLCTHNSSPLTGAVLPNKFLTPAIALRQLIASFKAEHPELVDSLV